MSGTVRPELTFSLVLTATILIEHAKDGKCYGIFLYILFAAFGSSYRFRVCYSTGNIQVFGRNLKNG